MKITIDDYVLMNMFNHFGGDKIGDTTYTEFWWAPVRGGGEGYLLLWKDGSSHHTYHNPETMISDWYYAAGLTEPVLDDRV